MISTAGHLRPVLAGPDGTAALAGVPVDRLVATVRADAPEVACATVMSDAADAPPTDDVAVLAVRRHG
ncbi:hypothetical protein [Actinoplanes xinjiangensis]|uniref:hypothetical protein n=1 Tax=Actinoplanes xinjiangensis TaxID=512350 RepID=UPI0034170FED